MPSLPARSTIPPMPSEVLAATRKVSLAAAFRRTCKTSFTIATGTVNPPIDLTGCYRNTFMPNGTVSEAGPCNGNPVLACVDNGQASNPFALEITIADLTEQVSVKQLSGLCPDI